jgi:hypothetical protein
MLEHTQYIFVIIQEQTCEICYVWITGKLGSRPKCIVIMIVGGTHPKSVVDGICTKQTYVHVNRIYHTIRPLMLMINSVR